MAENYTLTYSEGSKGWPSFYTYFPEIIKGMNQYLYTFKGGNLYSHNTNEIRNNYYGIQGVSEITSIFNQNPLINKKFKTISLEADDAWTGSFSTDIQNTGFIDDSYFEQKEGDWFAFIRNSGTVPASTESYSLRSLTGIGNGQNAGQGATSGSVRFEPPVLLGSIISIGDMFYFVQGNEPKLAGQITSIYQEPDGSFFNIVIDTTITGAVPITAFTQYYLFIKNSVQESQGVMGHYCEFTLTNDSTSATELFAVKSEAFKSFP